MAAPQTVFPVVHLNGSALSSLFADYAKAHKSLMAAFSDFAKIEFNERDYYPLGDAAFYAAKHERIRIAGCLKSVETYLESHIAHLCDQANKRDVSN